ncbi:hypothetical protein C1I63_04405 [Rathayibacter caricis DSM 15933]|uniref:Uncharacterized protein n=1 Tax=Rathayibacter caricis DSM 15933 TaxID=1328867 RepID=A0A2T4URL0_9MICO|nr:hypothetical protein C1I63_04405 [Rathayibacter caricis DSM 15933]
MRAGEAEDERGIRAHQTVERRGTTGPRIARVPFYSAAIPAPSTNWDVMSQATERPAGQRGAALVFPR